MRKLGVATKVLGGFVAFCALAFGPMERASAGCGDYLNVGRDSATTGKHSDGPLSPTTKQCNGPNCHRHDGPPLTPTPEIRPATPTFKSAAIATILALSAKSVVERSSDDDARPLPGYAVPILRPPQVV